MASKRACALAVFPFNPSKKNRNIGASAANALPPRSRCFRDSGGIVEPGDFVVDGLQRDASSHSGKIILVPITAFDVKGIPATRREGIEKAVEAAGRRLAVPHEAWIAADPFRGGFKVLITGPHRLERSVAFTLDEDPATITEQIRATLED